MEVPTTTRPDDASRSGRGWIGWLGALVFFAWGLAVLPQIGVGYDEPVHANYGELVLKFFQTGGEDRRNLTFGDLMYYGPLVDTLAALLYGGEGLRNYTVRHAVALFFAGMTLPAAFYLGRAAGGGWPAGLAAMLAMALMPRYMGYGFFNTKDVPFACLFTWALAWVWGIRGKLWRIGGLDALVLGLLAGLAMGVRVGGILVFGILGVAAGIAWVREVFLAKKLDAGRVRDTVVALGWWLVAFAMAYALMVAVWPWSWDRPFERPAEAMREFSAFKKSAWLLFDGRVVNTQSVPLSYLPAHLLLGTPLIWLALAGLGLGAALATLRKPLGGPREAVGLGVLVWLVLPLAYVLYKRPVLYGGGRQFLFLMPALATLAGLGFALLRQRLPRFHAWLWGGLAAGTLWAAWGVFSLHPYQYVYYNEFAGDKTTLGRRFELEDWNTSYREAAHWLNKHAETAPPKGPDRIYFAGSPYNADCLRVFLAPELRADPYLLRSLDRKDQASQHPLLPPEIDFYVAGVDINTQRMFAKEPVLYQIKAGKTVICEIRGRAAGAGMEQ